MRNTKPVPSDLTDAATVHAARDEIARAVGALAARPLDEAATGQMRQALQRVDSDEVRRAIRRLNRPHATRPALEIVRDASSLRPTPAPHTTSPQLALVGDSDVA